MRYLGIDYGSVRTGISCSDPTGIISSPLIVISSINEEKLLNEISNIINDKNIEALVLGMPINMNASSGKRMELTDAFKLKLEERFSLPVYYQDERLSTVEAQDILIRNNTRRSSRKKVIDKMAATIILQTFLDRSKIDGK
ncbi:MAG: Holliday junction resolvase RuvX [Bacilli bacterium]